jgi:hypothetical protein
VCPPGAQTVFDAAACRVDGHAIVVLEGHGEI